jgi:uncharacterized membrane protein YdjX (TVP38/TMEM64 family)
MPLDETLPPTPDVSGPRFRHRAGALAVGIGLAAVLVLARPAHQWLLGLIAGAEHLIQGRAALGMVLFVILAALSAMLAFVSSALLVPVAVYVWGPEVCFVLLWAGWFLGGLLAYTVGRYLGRPVVETLVSRETAARYETWVEPGASFVPIFLLQLALPSDVVGYLFGLARCRFTVFVAALGLAEVPYALGAVYLGASFLNRRLVPLLALGALGALLGIVALRRLHARGSMARR